jgi:hypothetical protein
MSWWRNALLLIVSVVVSLALAEVGLRLFSSKYAALQAHASNDRSTVAYRSLPGGLLTLRPKASFRHQTACTNIEDISVNVDGFRDRHWPRIKAGERIAVMGDSFIEALRVADGEHVAAVLARLTGARVLNAGIGGYATVTELFAYRRLVRPLSPDVVVGFVYPGNDVRGNSCRLDPTRTVCGEVGEHGVTYRDGEPAQGNRGAGTPSPTPTVDIPSGGTVVARLKGALRKHLVLYQALHDLKILVQGAYNQLRGYVPPRWQLYLNRELPDWEEAWHITEDALKTLKDEVEADGARLALVAIPEHFTTSREWRHEMMFGAASAVPDDFDPALPSRRLAAVATRIGVPLLDLRPALLAYRDANDLSYPYFSFTCDGHWNPLTHYLAGHATAAFLAQQGLVGKNQSDRAGLMSARRDAFAKGPKAILGTEAYQQIFEGGTYTGGAAMR